MANRANLIATYNANPTLQSRYTLQQYLDLFGFGATTTPTQTPTTTPTQTPATPGIPNIINQNLNPGGGGDGGPSNIPEPVQYFSKTYTGETFPDGTPIMSGFEETEGPGIMQGIANAFDTLGGLYSQFSPFGAIGRKIEQNKIAKQKIQDDAIAKAAAERAAQEAILDAQRRQQIGAQLQAAAEAGGGYQPTTTAQNVARTSSRVDSSGNIKAYGLADGGRVYLYNRLR